MADKTAKTKRCTKTETVRFLKKMVIFNVAYIIAFTAVSIIIYCIKGDYPEGLAVLTFAFFSTQVVIEAMIKIFEPKQKDNYGEYNYMPSDLRDREYDKEPIIDERDIK